jgi:hypothetical protein
MKSSPSKGAKAGAGARKKRTRNKVEGSARDSSPPMAPPCPNPNKEWKKSKVKTEDLLALVNSGFLREKAMDMWRAAAGDPYPMEKNPDKVPMFARFRGARTSTPSERLLQGSPQVLRYRVLELEP